MGAGRRTRDPRKLNLNTHRAAVTLARARRVAGPTPTNFSLIRRTQHMVENDMTAEYRPGKIGSSSTASTG